MFHPLWVRVDGMRRMIGSCWIPVWFQQFLIVSGVTSSHASRVLESVHTILTQPGTPVSFRGMCIYLLFDFRKLRNFRCFPFPENSGTPTFPFSGNSRLRRFSLLVIPSCISPFTCDSVVSSCFMYYSRLCTQVFSLYPVHTCPIP